MLRTPWWIPWRADAALAAGVLAVEMMMWAVGPDEWYSGAGPWLPLWIALTLSPIVVRRQWLWAAVAVTGVLILLGMLEKDLWAAQSVTLFVLAYTLAAYETWWRTVAGSALLWLANDLAFLAAMEN